MSLALSKSTSKFDWLGIALSSACAVHCLIVPVLLPVLVALKLGFLAEESFEQWAWIVTFGLCLLVTGYQFVTKHRHGSVLIPLAVAFGIMMNKETFGEAAEPFVALVAGLFLVLTHILNIKMCKSCPKCQSEKES